MSNRERWIVYPLLALALGIGLRNRIFGADSASIRHLDCEEIAVRMMEEEESPPVAIIRAEKTGGLLRLALGKNRELILQPTEPADMSVLLREGALIRYPQWTTAQKLSAAPKEQPNAEARR